MNAPDYLYGLLPEIHRQRDAARGYPLRALLGVIGEQVAVVEADIDRLYENWFIETCEDWVVPYLGDLVGYRPVARAGAARDSRNANAQAFNRALTPRREVANTLSARRRRGTLALLEMLANDVSGWPARGVEFFRLLGWTQHVNHLRLSRARTVDIRHGGTLARIGGAFDELAHGVDVRRIGSARRQGLRNVPNVGVFVWRLRAFPITRVPAYQLEERDRRCYTFNILGHQAPLFTLPEAEREPTHIAGELNVPAPISRRAFEQRPAGRSAHLRAHAASAYYGEGKSVAIWTPGWPEKDTPQPLPAKLIVPADLSHRHYRPRPGTVLVDPVLGRLEFPHRHGPSNVFVSYHYGFSGEMGGGEYSRTLSQPAGSHVYRVRKEKGKGIFTSIEAALDAWHTQRAALAKEKKSAVIEILDSRDYGEALRFDLEEGESLQLRAASGARPVLRLLDREVDGSDALRISGGQGSRFILDGMLVTGRGIHVCGPEPEEKRPGDLCDITIRHCTLVPGWALDCDCGPRRPTEASIKLIDTRASLKIERSILGPVHVTADAVRSEPVAVTITDSIWDALGEDHWALTGSNDTIAHATLTIARCTVLGGVRTHEIVLAENSIFTGALRVARRQRGCVRFCHVPAGHCSRTPRRYECQPDLVAQAIAVQIERGEIPEGEASAFLERARLRVEPVFTSTRYGNPAYCQLADSCAPEIRRGADDESEMGAFHDLFQPQREENLRARLDEFTPAGADVGIIFVT